MTKTAGQETKRIIVGATGASGMPVLVQVLRLIREAGVNAETDRQETEEDILLTIRIPKRRKIT